MTKILIFSLTFFCTCAYAELPINLKPGEEPIYVRENRVGYACNGNVEKDFLDLLYSYAKKYALKFNENPPQRKYCILSAVRLMDKSFLLLKFYENKPIKDRDGVQDGVSVGFGFKTEDLYTIDIFKSGQVIKMGTCINAKGKEVQC